MLPEKSIDIKENDLLKIDPELLAILLKDKTTGNNIIWATDNYSKYGFSYSAEKEIKIELITSRHGGIIKPRIEKSKTEQQQRVRQKAEVFTPSWICNMQNNKVDEEWFGRKDVFNLKSEVSENLGIIANKENQPSSSFKMKSHKDIIASIKNLFDNTVQKIREHNDIIDRLSIEKENLRKKIWCFLVKENESLISVFNNKTEICAKVISKMEERIKGYDSEKESLDIELKELNKKDITIQAAIDAINDILRNYGFMNFEIVAAQEENTYTLKRKDGSLVEDKLSEGETTFITFLYYMQLVHGSLNDDGVEKEKILVIDDPISSLDSNILFVVSSLIKEELKKLCNKDNKIKQIILLTHNIYFYKEVSFIDGRENTRKKITYWIIRKEGLTSEIQKYDKNPIVSSYDLYWREIREHEKDGKCNIYIQNTMRRIIEHYFKILGKYSDTTLLDKFENPNEKNIARSLLSWINDGSHSLPEDLFIEEPEQITNNYFDIFRKLFINAGQEEHYNMMMAIQD